MAVCAKMIPSWVRKVLNIAKPHMLQVLSRVLQHLWFWQQVFPWCLSCREVTRPGVLLQLDTVFQHASLLQNVTMIPCSMLSWALVSSQLVCKCQTLTNMKSWR